MAFLEKPIEEVLPLKNFICGEWVDSPSRWSMFHDYSASISELPYRIELSRTELIAAPRELALKPAIELFRRFGWDPSQDMLRDHQKELRR